VVIENKLCIIRIRKKNVESFSGLNEREREREGSMCAMEENGVLQMSASCLLMSSSHPHTESIGSADEHSCVWTLPVEYNRRCRRNKI